MPLLQSPDILPEAMRFILRVVLASEEPVPVEEARRLVAPATLGWTLVESRDEPDSKANKAGRLIFEKSLEGLRGLGVVTQERGRDRAISAENRIRERFPKWQQLTASAFSEFFLDEVLFGPRSSVKSGQSGGGDDLGEVLAFSLFATQPLRGFATFSGDKGRRFQDAQRELLGPDRGNWLVLNEERYRGMVRWLTYLGIARSFDNFMLIEPSSCLRRHVAAIVTQEMPLDGLLDRLGEHLPFTDRGAFGLRVRGLLSGGPPDGELSPGLALGLTTLQESGFIRLVNRDDASNLGFRIDPDAVNRYSHIAPGGAR
jgi:hypothetical protein